MVLECTGAGFWHGIGTGLARDSGAGLARDSSSIARFTTADPYGGSARPGAPQTWNRYSYVGGDPVNRNDPAGLMSCSEYLGRNLGWGFSKYDPCVGIQDASFNGGFASVPGMAAYSSGALGQFDLSPTITGNEAAYLQGLVATYGAVQLSGQLSALIGQMGNTAVVTSVVRYDDGTSQSEAQSTSAATPSVSSMLVSATQMLGSIMQSLGGFLGYRSPGVSPTSLPIVAGSASIPIPSMPGLTVEIPGSIDFNTGTITIGIGIAVGTPGANVGLVSLGTASNAAAALNGCSWGAQAQPGPVGFQVIGGTGNGLVVGPAIGSPGGSVGYACSASFTLP